MTLVQPALLLSKAYVIHIVIEAVKSTSYSW